MQRTKPTRLRRSNLFTAMTSKVSSDFMKNISGSDNDASGQALMFVSIVLDREPHKFSINISTEDYDADMESNGLGCKLVFTYTEKYPDAAPLVEIEDPINFEDEYEEQLLDHVKETVCQMNFAFN